MSILAKKMKTPQKMQKYNNLKNAKYQKVNQSGPFSLLGLAEHPLAPQSVTPLPRTLNFLTSEIWQLLFKINMEQYGWIQNLFWLMGNSTCKVLQGKKK